MPLFENIEKLITEHGSAAILRERLSLAADKYSALERKVAKLEEEVATLRRQNEELRANVAPSPDSLPREEETVLKMFAELNAWLTIESVARHLNLSLFRAEAAIDSLIDKEFVQASGIDLDDSERTYRIDKKGRAFAIRHGLAR